MTRWTPHLLSGDIRVDPRQLALESIHKFREPRLSGLYVRTAGLQAFGSAPPDLEVLADNALDVPAPSHVLEKSAGAEGAGGSPKATTKRAAVRLC